VSATERSVQLRTIIVDNQQPRVHRLTRGRRDFDDGLASARANNPPADAFQAARIPPQIVAEKLRRIYFLDTRTVEYVAAAGNYVVAHISGEEYLARATLKRLAPLLEPLGYVRIERSLLVNLRQVAHVERLERGQYCFVMRRGARLASSRERNAEIRAMLLGATSPVLF
jgi:DNA-binding LytR/AlgR family response regulator